MADPRVIKVTFAITGEIEIHAKRIIERNIKNKGLEAYEYRIQTKSRDMTEEDFPQIKEPVSNEPPF